MPAGGDVVNVADIAAAQAASNLRPMCRLTQVGTGTSMVSSANTTLAWDTEDYDYGGLHAAGSTNVVLTRSGIWEAIFTLFVPARSDYTTIGAVIAKNGVNQAPWDRVGPNATSAQRTARAYAKLACASGDILTAVGNQANAAASTLVTPVGSSFESVFEVTFIRDL